MDGQRSGVEGRTQPEILIPANILSLGDNVTEGQLIEAVALPWFDILKELERNPSFLHRLDWRKVEELIAGAYKREGWPEVILTPRSGDRGRDIIVSRPGFGALRFIDQVKAYAPDRRVTAAEVRELFGVLNRDPNVSKAILTTTATFAPGIEHEWKEWVPFRIELRDGAGVAAWLKGLSQDRR
jgi:restriction system protein